MQQVGLHSEVPIRTMQDVPRAGSGKRILTGKGEAHGPHPLSEASIGDDLFNRHLLSPQVSVSIDLAVCA
jgi:hypothetical protein